jgi:hypothetical protein
MVGEESEEHVAGDPPHAPGFDLGVASIALTGDLSANGSSGTSMKLTWVAPLTWMV